MRIDGLRQAPFNCTFMGVMHGIAACREHDVSAPTLYGVSGHAFVMNIHRQLCPSGPYCFDRAAILTLLRNLGIATEDLGFFHARTPLPERAAAEAAVRSALDAGRPCWLVNMEFQLIPGYDETGFVTEQPWPGHDFPPAHLTFGTWTELGEEMHVNLCTSDECPPADRAASIRQALAYAVGLWRDPDGGVRDDYATGAGAYENWLQAVRDGHGPTHGNWWNGTVWAECRNMAGAFMQEAADMLPDPAAARSLGEEFKVIGGLLGECSSKELPDGDKLGKLAEARDREASCIDRIEALLHTWV